MPNSTARKPSAQPDVAPSWLLLSYQVPRSPAAQYMSMYRRMKTLHVLHVRAGLVALPAGAEAEAMLQRLATRINSLEGGAAVLLRSDVVNDVDHLVSAYNDERNAEYDDIVSTCERLARMARGTGRRDDLAVRRRITRVAADLDAISRRDPFHASHRGLAIDALNRYRAAMSRQDGAR